MASGGGLRENESGGARALMGNRVIIDSFHEKPLLALIDTSGSVSRQDIERQLCAALSLTGAAGGWFAFYDHELRSELTPLTADTVGETIACGHYPGGGGDDVPGVVSAALALMEESGWAGPARVAIFSDLMCRLPTLAQLDRKREGDEFYLCGDCREPEASLTDGVMREMKERPFGGPGPELVDSQTIKSALAEFEAREIARCLRAGAVAPARGRSISI